jgi:hypothetical protein
MATSGLSTVCRQKRTELDRYIIHKADTCNQRTNEKTQGKQPNKQVERPGESHEGVGRKKQPNKQAKTTKKQTHKNKTKAKQHDW